MRKAAISCPTRDRRAKRRNADRLFARPVAITRAPDPCLAAGGERPCSERDCRRSNSESRLRLRPRILPHAGSGPDRDRYLGPGMGGGLPHNEKAPPDGRGFVRYGRKYQTQSPLPKSHSHMDMLPTPAEPFLPNGVFTVNFVVNKELNAAAHYDVSLRSRLKEESGRPEQDAPIHFWRNPAGSGLPQQRRVI